jgi:hypothetical protein
VGVRGFAMLSNSRDYIYMSPQSGDIKGEIIPTSDIAGTSPLMRKEDIYYLLEMYYDMKRQTSSVSGSIDERVYYYKLHDIEYLFSKWGSAADVAKYYDALGYYNNVRFKELPPAGVEMPMTNTNTTPFSEFLSWMAQNYPQYFVTMPSVTGELGLYKATLADTLRKMYYGMNQSCYELFKLGTVFPQKYRCTVPMGQTLTYKTFSYSSADDTITTTDVVRYFVENNLAVALRYQQDSGSYSSNVGQIAVIRGYDDKGNNRYKRLNGFPSSDVYCEIAFDSSLVIAGAFVCVNYYFFGSGGANQIRKIILLEPTERVSDTRVRFKFFRPDIMRKLVEDLGIPWAGDSDWTSSRGQYGEGEVAAGHEMFAKLSNKYTALPAEWVWSPS